MTIYCISDGRNKKPIVSYYVLSLFRGVAKYMFTVLFIIWMTAIFTRHHGAWRGDRSRWRTTRTKRGTTSVAWAHVFKHCSLKQPILSRWNANNRAMCAPSLFLCERTALFFFRFIDFERLHKHTYMRQESRLCKYPHNHSDLGLREKTAERENAYVTVYWIRTSVLKGKRSNIHSVCHSY